MLRNKTLVLDYLSAHITAPLTLYHMKESKNKR